MTERRPRDVRHPKARKYFCVCIIALALYLHTLALVCHVLMTYKEQFDIVLNTNAATVNQIEDNWCAYNLEFVLKRVPVTETHTHLLSAASGSMVGMCAHRTATQWRSFPRLRVHRNTTTTVACYINTPH